MAEIRDLARPTKLAVIALWVFMAVKLLFGLAALQADVLSRQPDDGETLRLIDALGGIYALLLLATVIIVGRWIYKASANAHQFAPDMTITPGWAVGWYFVPFANLVMPFRAMREVWLASHHPHNWQDHFSSPLLGWWWGLWIADNVLSNISFRVETPQIGGLANFAGAIVAIPLSLILISIIKDVASAQSLVSRQEVFA